MKKVCTIHTGTLLIISALATLTFVLATAKLACANTRDEAQKVLYVLRQTGVAEKAPDEMHSVDATFLTAEQYFQQNDHEQSNRYYLLAVQKARVLLAKLLDPASGSMVPAASKPPDIPQAATSPLSQPGAKPPAPANDDAPLIPHSIPASSQSQDAKQNETQAPSAPAQAKTEAEYFSEGVTSEMLVGTEDVYTVVKNDTLRLVAARLGVSRQHLSRLNNLDPKAPLKAGKKLKYNNRKIIPQAMKNGIVINIPDRTLYYFKQGKLSASIPVALGTPKKSDKYDWKTPTGKFKITAKQKDPVWHVPPSIQSEMEDQGKEVITTVPPGPENPLGKFAIKTSLPGIMIHSTTKPGSIYSFASHGCIRVSPQNMEEFFKEIKVNTPGEIIYRPVKLAVTEEGRIFMEVHQDAYGTGRGLDAEAKQMIEKHDLSDRVDWKKVESVVRHKDGIAEDISL